MPILKNYTRYKITGHILFWICSIAFALTAFYVASNNQLGLNGDVLLRAIIPNIGFALAVYLNIYLLIPRFLKNKNYIFYTFWLLILLALTSLLIQFLFVSLLNMRSFQEQFRTMFSSHFFTAAFYVGMTSLFKFVKDWLELQEMQLKLSQIEREKLEAELNTLKSQLNPHFLFNCLNNIYSLALNNSPQTPEIILKLSDLMRHVLYESRENFVPVRHELDFLVNFIELQKIRLNSKIEISYEIEGTIPEKKVIPLIFEPFIDNAFKHGMQNPATHPFLKASIRFGAETMHFKVENNYSSAFPSIKSKSSGIGLKNIKKRLEFLYLPDEYNYQVLKTENTFTVLLDVKLKS
jgi:sensor histidine kinase YesM